MIPSVHGSDLTATPFRGKVDGRNRSELSGGARRSATAPNVATRKRRARKVSEPRMPDQTATLARRRLATDQSSSAPAAMAAVPAGSGTDGCSTIVTPMVAPGPAVMGGPV